MADCGRSSTPLVVSLLLRCFLMCRLTLLFAFLRDGDFSVKQRGAKEKKGKGKAPPPCATNSSSPSSAYTPPEGIDFVVNHSRHCFAARLVCDFAN